ncbi:MAG: helix-turn-helix domain-containing protein [Alphaproteobacteria bacterium]|nr:helix-turn-helix domain-containing protein [Alphaproteobacteria bacterium]
MTRIYEKIRQALEATPGLTQKGLAARMGLNPAAVNRMLYGRRNIMAEEIPIIEDYLGMALSLAPSSGVDVEYTQDKSKTVARHRGGMADVGGSASALSAVPVYNAGGAAGGLVRGPSPVDWAARHPAQAQILDAYAVYYMGGDMAPRYFRGELVYLHPGRPAKADNDVLLTLASGQTLLRRVIADDGKILRVAMYNPATEETVRHADIKDSALVLARG